MSICNRCRKSCVFTPLKNGKLKKTCDECLAESKIYADAHPVKKCIHDKVPRLCEFCLGTGLCIHKVSKHNCRKCKGSSICIHDKLRNACLDCHGSSICIHDKQRASCKKCIDPIRVTITHMIRGSKQHDKKYNRYDPDNFIDYDYCNELITNSGMVCCYCSQSLQLINYAPDEISIERIDNSIGHIKGNVKISCLGCNHSVIGGKKIGHSK